MLWLVRLRWLFVAAAAAVVGFAAARDIVDAALPLVAIVAGVAIANAWFSRESAALADESDLGELERVVTLQLAFDVVALSLLLYWSGGSDNPFAFFFVFPMTIAGMLLPLRRAVLIALLAVTMFAGLTVAQMVDAIPHHSIHLGFAGSASAEAAPLWRSPVYVAGYFAAFLCASLGAIAFSSVLAHRLREAEQLQYNAERIAESRERLVRIGSLAAGVAHTIRNPLHGMLNCAGLLRHRVGGTPEIDDILDLMAEGGDRIEGITRRLLAATRNDYAERSVVGGRRLLSDAAQFLEVLARERDVTIEVDASPGLSVTVDADRFVEALVCLLENAVQACEPGGRVNARATVGSEPGDGAVFEVADTGAGMSDEVRSHVFEPFFTTKPIGEGTGLGLAICRRVVEQHGGTIAVDSRPRKGATIRIQLPVTATNRRDENVS